jgi:hypothetical protein
VLGFLWFRAYGIPDEVMDYLNPILRGCISA